MKICTCVFIQVIWNDKSHLEWQEHRHQLQGQTGAFSGHVHIFVCMWHMDHNSRHWKKDTGIGDEMFPQTPWYITNEEVKARIGNAIRWYEDVLTSVKRHKLKWYGHITWSSGLAKTILQGTVQGRRRGRQRKWWEDNIKEWTGLEWNIILWKAENREEWRKLVVESTVVPQQSARLQDRWDEIYTSMYTQAHAQKGGGGGGGEEPMHLAF